MRQHYMALQNLLSDEPQTIRQLTEIIYRDDKRGDAMYRRQSVNKSLDQLRENGLATSYVKDNVMYWVRGNVESIPVQETVTERIIAVMGDREWWTTRSIAEEIYDDFNEPFKSNVYMARMNAQLHRLLKKGVVDQHLEVGPNYFQIAKWRLTEAVA